LLNFHLKKSPKIVFSFLSSIIINFSFSAFFTNIAVSAPTSFNFSGSEGYSSAYKKFESTGKPLVVYFNTEWCGYCKKLNINILNSDIVKTYLSDKMAAVSINPDLGEREKDLAKKFSVTGYPSFFILPDKMGNPIKISPYKKAGNDFILMNPKEFIGKCNNLISDTYNQKGFILWQKSDYLNSGKYFNQALNYDHNNAESYYGLAVYYENLAYNKKNKLLLDKSEEEFKKSLKIDPTNQNTKKELNKLYKYMEKLGHR
jgi:thiol-disulfide isomerase/thioredoxin